MKPNSPDRPPVVPTAEWLAARRDLLQREKELARQYDALAARRRALPWTRVAQDYVFAAERGAVSLADLFAGRRQLIVQHFMFGPGWKEGCPSCSFMLDHIAPTVVHLNARDVSFAAVSHAPLRESLPFKRRLGWNVAWVSSHGTSFNHDFHVSFSEEQMASGTVEYNYRRQPLPNCEAPGISVFARGDDDTIHHTYSTFQRGVEVIMGTYHLLDLTPLGRQEDGLEYGTQWVRYHDRYEASANC